MIRMSGRVSGVIVCVASITALAGWDPAANSAEPSDIGHAFDEAKLLGIPPVPARPKPFAIPAQPIVAASSDGYLALSQEVTSKGELSLTLPLSVPPGRAGMEPAMALNYLSGAADGVLGVGWSLSGMSTITRCPRTWAEDGETDGVDFSTRDRFCLDGIRLVGVNATPYGGNGAEYRTDPDTFVRIHSTSSQALDPIGPEQFVVELGDGRTRTYGPVAGERVSFADDNSAFTHETTRVQWQLLSEQDASGNAISYEYEDFAGPGGANASDYWFEVRPLRIRYTGNFTNGLPTHGSQDLPQRSVEFLYEDRPDSAMGWISGVQWRHGSRLKTIRMTAPNPVANSVVWQYNIDYAMSGSQRSLLVSVQRCASIGGCLWAKRFGYAASSNDVLFKTQPIVHAPILTTDLGGLGYDLSQPALLAGEVPAMHVLDLNGDGGGDLLFGPGAAQLFEEQWYPAPFNALLPDGKFLGGSHSLWLSQRDASGEIVPFGQGLSIARDEVPLATANYGHVRLDEATAVDLDGDGKSELVAVIDNTGAHEITADPNLPQMRECAFADLKWTGAGFVHTAERSCTLLGQTNGAYNYYVPNEFPTFADFNGDGLPDRAWSYNTAGWIGSNNPNDPPQFEFAPAWRISLNETATPGYFGPATNHDAWEASPGVVTDSNGDGRAELTSEALKTSLAFDDNGQWAKQSPDTVHLPTSQFGPLDGYREFGDFNGDGLDDLLRLTRSNPARPGLLNGQIYWNTGRGFYPDTHARAVSVDVHSDWAKQIHTKYGDNGVHITDINNDGRMDVVVFNNDHLGSNRQSEPQIEFLLSNGDGTFVELDQPVTAGTRIDTKYWIDNTLRPILYYPDRLQNDVMRMGIAAFASAFGGGQAGEVLLAAVPFQEYEELGGAELTPGLASGWNLATLADMNGDGYIDIVRHVGGNDANGGFEVMQQTAPGTDELISVTDEKTAWPALSIGYSSEWSDRPEVNDSYQCEYPLTCPKGGLRVVRAVTSRAGLTDLKPGDNPLQMGHTWQYSYRDPVANVQGLGFLGFSERRVWDAEPTHPVETITTFDLRTPDASGKRYPGAGVPAKVTSVQPILQPNQNQPANAPARLTRTTYTYELRSLDNGTSHAVFPQSTHTSAWEEPVAIFWSGQGPDHQHLAGYSEPASPPIHVDTQVTVDDYGNVSDTASQTIKGLYSEVSRDVLNDTANWHIGLISAQTTTSLESEKNAVPVVQHTTFGYTSKGQLQTIEVEPNAADPSLSSATTLTYDDYGLVTSATTNVANEPSRARHVEYATAWPGAPDEHLFASELWAEHDNPACVVDCRPAAFALVHPAYGAPIATMDGNGVQTAQTYDGHGRPVFVQGDGQLPVTLAYAGRPDTFGGINGTQVTASTGSQQIVSLRDARGARVRTSATGFDGQWINTFSTYDLLGRRVGDSKPATGAPGVWTHYAYDSLGRNVETSFPDGSATKAAYALLQTEHWDARGDHSYTIRDVDGRLVTSGNTVPVPGCAQCAPQDVKSTYQYSAKSTGALMSALDDQGHETTTQYDRRGRPIQETDPSRGTTTATYNGFGEKKQLAHAASGQLQTSSYDDLGRTISQTSPDGLTSFSWDTATHGIGRLARAFSADQIKTEYRYDDLGRTQGIDQTDELNGIARLDLNYDPQTGRVASIDYPEVPGRARFRAKFDYNAYGYLTTVLDASPNQPAQVLEQVTARNADLAPVDRTRGGTGANAALQEHRDYDPLMGRLWAISSAHAGANRLKVSYDYDADGLVDQRTMTDEATQISETFEHDALHRLTHVGRDGILLEKGLPFASSIDESYDTVGNRIDTTRNGQLVEHRSYGSNGAQPYAVTQRSVFDAPNVPPKKLDYAYDDMGRLKNDPMRTLTWTAFDLPHEVTESGQTTTFRYGAGGERVVKEGPDGRVTYLAGLYERRDNGGAPHHIFHVLGGDGPVADVDYAEAAMPSLPGTTTIRYPISDALGSTNAIADANGTVSEHDYYDSWGLRSNPDGTPLADLTLFHSAIPAGFTGHEHDDALGLVNMQGRMYDPALGRFLSPDPVVGAPAFSQSWNSYSYVLNSPLNLTDPSGFDCSAPMAVAMASEQSYIANGVCTGNNATLPNGDEVTVTDASRAPDMSNLVSNATAFIHDQQRAAALSRAVEQSRRLPDGTLVKAPDGTPIPKRWIDARNGNRQVDNWGTPLSFYPDKNLIRNYSDNPAVKYVGKFATRLSCGSKCASASGPTSAGEAANAPKQLSSVQIARNALSQALAARALLKFVGKVGVVVDEGVDGLIDALTPEPPAMSDQDRQFARALKQALAKELRQRIRAEAFNRVTDALQRVNAARAKWIKFGDQAVDAGEDLESFAHSTQHGPQVSDGLLGRVFLGDADAAEQAHKELEAETAKLLDAQETLDVLDALDDD